MCTSWVNINRIKNRSFSKYIWVTQSKQISSQRRSDSGRIESHHGVSLIQSQLGINLKYGSAVLESQRAVVVSQICCVFDKQNIT